MSDEVERARAAVEEKYRVEIAEARKAGLPLIEIDEMRKLELTKIDQDVAVKRADWEKKQLDTIAEMELGYIKDKTEREKAAINFKYDLAVRRAKELGMATDSIERQRTIALELAGMGKEGRNTNRPQAQQWNPMLRGGEGGAAIDYTQKTATEAEKQTKQGDSLVRLIQRLVDYVTRNPNSGGQGLTPSNWQ